MNSKHLMGWLVAMVLSAASAATVAQSGGMMGDGAGRGMGSGRGPDMKRGMMGDDGSADCGYHAMKGASGHGMGMDMGMGMGMGAGMMSGHHGHLPPDITDKQRSAINKIHDDFTKKQWELNGKLLDEYPKLRDLHAAEARDPKAIGAEYARIFDVRRQMIELSVDMHNRVEAVFTKEQREAMHKHRRGPMMGQ